MFVKYNNFTVSQKQCGLAQPTDVTAVILNEARKLLAEAWDGITPIRQVGLGVSKLTHESAVQMSLFEDPKMEYYREWDRQYDEEKAKAEDARMLAYERKKAELSGTPMPETPPPPTVVPPQHYRTQLNYVTKPVRRQAPKDDALVFRYPTGEAALSAAKKAVRSNPAYRFHRHILDDGTDCFEVLADSKVIERHIVGR